LLEKTGKLESKEDLEMLIN